MGSLVDVDSWNPYVSQQAFASDVLRRIYLPLAVERPEAAARRPEFAPLLAESWSVSDGGRALTFVLREATWSDGVPITADDVRFTWSAQTAAAVPWIDAARKARIRDVVVVDARTARFEFDGAYPGQLADAAEGPILPRHRFADVPFVDWAQHAWAAAGVGSGPYLLERHAPGHEIVLARNPHAPGDGPWLDRIVVRIVPDIANLVTQLGAGQLDYVEGLPPREAASLAERRGITLLAFDQPSYDYLGWNASRPPLDDAELRRALTLAIDRQDLVDSLLFGYGRVSAGPVLSFWWAADPSLAPLPYDPEEARRILLDHGRSELALTVLTQDASELRMQALLKVQEQLARVGVRVEIRPMEMRAMRARIAAGDYDGYVGSWVYSMQDLASVFRSDSRPPQGANLVAYASPAADAALDRAARAEDLEAMRQALVAFQRTVHEDQPYTFLYERQRLAAYGPRVGGLVIDTPSDPLASLERAWLH